MLNNATPDFFDNIGGTLVSRYPYQPGFKRGGTSELSAKQTQPTVSSLRDLVLSALRQSPRTADETALALGKSVLAIRPRLSELSRLGLIVETSERRRNASGKLATVYRIL
jgi:hypothetical protein